LAASIPRLRNSAVSPGLAALATQIAFLRYGLASASSDSPSGYQGASRARPSRRSVSPDFMGRSTRMNPYHCPAKGRSASTADLWSCNKGLGVIQSSRCDWCPNNPSDGSIQADRAETQRDRPRNDIRAVYPLFPRERTQPHCYYHSNQCVQMKAPLRE
jgi:hypothetical protein